MTDPPPVNPKALTTLRRIGGSRLVADMVTLFLGHSAGRLEAMLAAPAGETSQLRQAAHSLKSSAGSLGLTEVLRLADAVEAACLAGDRARAAGLLPGLREAYERVVPLLEKERELAMSRKTVAVVEDNPDNRLLVRALLQDEFDIDEYEGGAAALAGLRRRRPDLLLLDISLPGMDGTEVLRQVRADPALRPLPVIALTAHAMLGDAERYLGLGFDAYVAKPIVEEDEFLGAIRACLARGAGGEAPPPR